MPELDRRRFLAGIGAVAVAPRLPVAPRRQPAPAPFSWGVASFDPTTDGVLLWTRVAEPPQAGATTVDWVLAADEALTDVVQSGSVTVSMDTDRCARVEVADLPDGRTWWYAFTTPDGTRSPIGRTRTLPRDGDRLRVGVASCARFATAGYAAYRALADREVDLVVHLGDYIYEDGESGARPHEPARRCTTLDDYRARYAQHRTDPDLQALHARHPMVAVGDDHEVAGNAWRDGAVSHDDGRDGPWLPRLLAAGQAHEEWLPGRTGRGTDGRLRSWRALDLGGLAELLVLDTRTWGRDRQPSSAAELTAGADRSLLGPDQMAFAAERLGSADRPPWVLVANQVMFHPLQLPTPGVTIAEAVRDRGFLIVDGQAVNPDQWDGYPGARDELVAAMGGTGGVVVLTGDVHSSWAWEGPATDGDGGAAMVELVTPSISSSTFADRMPIPVGVVEAGLPLVAPDLRYVELEQHGYLLVDCTPDRMQGEWWHVDPSDPTTQRLGAARSTPRAAPMRLTEETVATSDPSGDDAPSTTASTAPPAAPPADDDGGGDGGRLLVGAGAFAALAAGAAAVALRRRPTGG